MQEPKIHPLDLYPLDLHHFSVRRFGCVRHPPRRPLCRGCGRAGGGWVLPQAQDCTALHRHPWGLLSSAWSTVAPRAATVQPEGEGGKGRGTKCSSPLRTRLKSYSVSTCTRWPDACLVATPRCKGVWKVRS